MKEESADDLGQATFEKEQKERRQQREEIAAQLEEANRFRRERDRLQEIARQAAFDQDQEAERQREEARRAKEEADKEERRRQEEDAAAEEEQKERLERERVQKQELARQVAFEEQQAAERQREEARRAKEEADRELLTSDIIQPTSAPDAFLQPTPKQGAVQGIPDVDEFTPLRNFSDRSRKVPEDEDLLFRKRLATPVNELKRGGPVPKREKREKPTISKKRAPPTVSSLRKKSNTKRRQTLPFARLFEKEQEEAAIREEEIVEFDVRGSAPPAPLVGTERWGQKFIVFQSHLRETERDTAYGGVLSSFFDFLKRKPLSPKKETTLLRIVLYLLDLMFKGQSDLKPVKLSNQELKGYAGLLFKKRWVPTKRSDIQTDQVKRFQIPANADEIELFLRNGGV